MSKKFFLASHDYLSSPEPRSCEVQTEYVIRQTGQRVYYVSVDPPIPIKTEDAKAAGFVLLGMIDNTDLNQIGERELMTDIYFLKSKPTTNDIDAKKLWRIGMGTLHLSFSDAWAHSPIEPNPSNVPATGERVVRKITFLGEQDGEPERILKKTLSRYFRENQQIRRAYLVRARYDEDEFDSVALCLALDSQEISSMRKRIGEIFATQFNKNEYLDIIVLAKEQEMQIRNICMPFFDAEPD